MTRGHSSWRPWKIRWGSNTQPELASYAASMMLLYLNISRVPQTVALKVHLIRTETALCLDKEGLTFLENFMPFEWGHPNSTSSIYPLPYSWWVITYSDALDFYTFSVVLQLELMSESFVGCVETHIAGPLPPTELLSQFNWDCCCCSVAQSCPTLCYCMDCSTPGFPVLHHLPEYAQTHVH